MASEPSAAAPPPRSLASPPPPQRRQRGGGRNARVGRAHPNRHRARRALPWRWVAHGAAAPRDPPATRASRGGGGRAQSPPPPPAPRAPPPPWDALDEMGRQAGRQACERGPPLLEVGGGEEALLFPPCDPCGAGRLAGECATHGRPRGGAPVRGHSPHHSGLRPRPSGRGRASNRSTRAAAIYRATCAGSVGGAHPVLATEACDGHRADGRPEGLVGCGTRTTRRRRRGGPVCREARLRTKQTTGRPAARRPPTQQPPLDGWLCLRSVALPDPRRRLAAAQPPPAHASVRALSARRPGGRPRAPPPPPGDLADLWARWLALKERKTQRRWLCAAFAIEASRAGGRGGPVAALLSPHSLGAVVWSGRSRPRVGGGGGFGPVRFSRRAVGKPSSRRCQRWYRRESGFRPGPPGTCAGHVGHRVCRQPWLCFTAT